jgi:hypothetical protein
MIKLCSWIAANSLFDFSPVTVAKLVGNNQQQHVTLFCEVLWLLSWLWKYHVVSWVLIIGNFPSDYFRCHLLELNYFLSLLHVLTDLLCISESLNLLKENGHISFYIFGTLGLSNIPGDTLKVVRTEELKRLTKLLEVTPIPIVEPCIPVLLFLLALCFSKYHLLDALQIACIFRIHLLLEKVFQSFRVWEEPEVLDF